jgi:hypothetical protein
MWPKDGKHKDSYYDADSHDAKSLIAQGVKLTPLTTLADVMAALREPSEAMWGGLARDIVFWLDTTDKRTPRSLFKFLGNVGREVPEWIKTHMEMANLDHAISKGTRATIIFLAMLDQFDRDQGSAT